MKSILISMIILIYIQTTLSARELSAIESSMYDSEYVEEIQIKNAPERKAGGLAVNVIQLEDNNFEVKFSANKYFKPFVIIGAKISEFLSNFSLDNLNKGIGANIQMNESSNFYAKYSSCSILDERLLSINSSAMYVGIEYSF